MTLKEELIRLGELYPDLQDHLRVIIDQVAEMEDSEEEEATEDTKDEHTPEPESGSVFNVPKAPPSEENIFFNLSPASFRAFNTVILPQIQAKLDETSFEDLTLMMDEMAGLGKAKNVDLENALIVFKPISMNTKKFYTEIQEAFRNWLRPKMKSLSSPNAGTGSSENVNVYVLPK